MSNQIIIDPSSDSLWTGIKELWEQRELTLFLSWRNLRVRYQQTILGALWAILQPFLTMIVFSLFFGGLAQIPSDGIPYPLFAYTALVPWTLFATSITQSSQSLVGNANLIQKVYFPRLVIPISTVFSVIVDFFLSFAVLIVLLIFYSLIPDDQSNLIFANMLSLDTSFMEQGFTVGRNVIFLPAFFLLTVITATGVGLWFSAMNVQFRDIRYTIPFIVQLWLFSTPIAYPSSLLSDEWRTIYSLNPMVGVVEGFRWALLGVDTEPGATVFVSVLVSLFIFVSGLWYFKRVEDNFADVV